MNNLEQFDSTEGHNDHNDGSGWGEGIGVKENEYVDDDVNDPIVQAQRAALDAVRNSSLGVGLGNGLALGVGGLKAGVVDDDDDSTVILIEDNSQQMVKKNIRGGYAPGQGLGNGNNNTTSPRPNANGVVITGGGQGLRIKDVPNLGQGVIPSQQQPQPQPQPQPSSSQPPSVGNQCLTSQTTTTATTAAVVSTSTAPTTTVTLKPRPPLVSGASVRQSVNTRISFNSANANNGPSNGGAVDPTPTGGKSAVVRSSFLGDSPGLPTKILTLVLKDLSCLDPYN